MKVLILFVILTSMVLATPNVSFVPNGATRTLYLDDMDILNLTIQNIGTSDALNVSFASTSLYVAPSNFNVTIGNNTTVQVTYNGSSIGIFNENFTTKFYFIQSGNLVHDPLLDKTVFIDYTVMPKPTNMTLDVFIDSMTIESDGIGTGVLQLINTGASDAFSITFDMLDTSFEKNNFDLESGKSEIIKFFISIGNLFDNSTNKTYIFNLSVIGNDFSDLGDHIDVFVPYRPSVAPIIEEEDPWIMLERYCAKYPNATFCSPGPKIIQETITIYVEKNQTINITEDTIKSMEETLNNLEEKEERDENRDNLFVDEFTNFKEEVGSDFDYLSEEQSKIRSTQENNSQEMSNYLDREQQREQDASFKNTMEMVVIFVVIIFFILGYVFRKPIITHLSGGHYHEEV